MSKIVFIFLLVICTKSHSAMVYGSGVSSCGKWNAASQLYQKEPLLQWVLGYVTFASILEGKIDALPYIQALELKDTDVEAILGWVDNYCQENPIDNIQKASSSLVEVLNKNKNTAKFTYEQLKKLYAPK